MTAPDEPEEHTANPGEMGSVVPEVGISGYEKSGSPAEFLPADSSETIRVDKLSLSSLYLKLRARGKELGTATGFIMRYHKRMFLVTNWHVLSGRRTDNEQPCHSSMALPNEVRIAHHIGENIGRWQFIGEPLCDGDDNPRWIAHPRGRAVDVAVLELSRFPDVARIYPITLELADVPLRTPPGTPVSIIGFPLGLRPNVFFGLWKTGHVASDVEIPYQGQSAFLIDATTHEGMSGSPVVARQWMNLPADIEPGSAGIRGREPRSPSVQVRSELVTKFLGVYSGRIHGKLEIGCVWRPSAIKEVLDRAVARPPEPL